MKLPQVIEEREVSGFPVSVGTGLALETLFKPIQDSLDEIEREQIKDLSVYNLYVINVNTILRNLLNGFKHREIMGIHPKFFYHVFMEELTFIEEFFLSNNIKLEMYVNTYEFFVRIYKDKMRKATTDKQIIHDIITDYCMKNVVKDKPNVREFSKGISYEKKSKILLLSHVPVDLLESPRYASLDLLESHTGAIKSQRHFNTKYYKLPGRDMSFLPFMEYLLTTFGDSVMFKPAPIKDRINLYTHLEAKGVNPLTSEMSSSFLF